MFGSYHDLPEEAGRADDMPAHGIERSCFHGVERAGYSWMRIADPARLFDTDAEALPMMVRTPADPLRRLLAATPSAPTGPEQGREAA